MLRRYFALAYLFLVTVSVATFSFSRYSKVFEMGGTAVVARPVVTYVPYGLVFNDEPVEGGDGGIDLSDVMPGDVLVYHFDVRNYEGEITNQVLMKYRVRVVFNPSEATLPLDYSLSPSGNYPSAGGGWVYMGFDGPTSHRYTLTVSWNENVVGPEYTNKQQSIEIHIDSEQAERPD